MPVNPIYNNAQFIRYMFKALRPGTRLFYPKLFLIAFIVMAIVIQGLWSPGIFASNDLLNWSNYLQIFVAFVCSIMSVYLYFKESQKRIYLLSGFAFAGWFLSNIYWYLHIQLLGRGLLYPCISDAGFLGFFLFMAAGIQLTFSKKKVNKFVLPALYAILLIVPAILAISRPGMGSVVTMIYFLSSAVLLSTIVAYYDKNNMALTSGAVLYCVTMILYALRESYFVDNPVFTIVGQVAIISFSCIQIGLLGLAEKGDGQ